MIKAAGNIITPESISLQYPKDSIELKIINILSASIQVYEYSSMEYLKFELNLRKSIIDTSKALYKSGMSFKVFRKSTCNTDYWERNEEGGFSLKQGVKPSDAMKDIFINGSKYGTECSTAIVILFYKAVLNIFPEDIFNKIFPDIYLMNWHYIDSDLGINYYENVKDYLPGDCRYFKNPDVNPSRPEWQGENTIDLGNETYYGHGAGIRNANKMIELLNELRKEDASETAFLVESATRPDFEHLARIYLGSQA